jgi:hypothetical protein
MTSCRRNTSKEMASDNSLLKKEALCIFDFIMHLLDSSLEGQNILAIAGQESPQVVPNLIVNIENNSFI